MNNLLITHNDLDGISPVILSKIAFGRITYLSIEISDITKVLDEIIQDKKVLSYDNIFIIDLGVPKDYCEKINKHQLKNKIKIFDHHKNFTHINNYSFGKLVDENEEGYRESGTSLYYDYLLENYNNESLSSKAVIDYVELVRLYDTWEWFENEILDAKKLNNLFKIYGEDYFIHYYYNFLIKNDMFYFTDKDMYVLDIEQSKIERITSEKEPEMISAKLNDYNVGIIFSEYFKDEIGSFIAEKYNDKYDFIIVINSAGGVSFRGANKVDLGLIAQTFGGNGHFNASGIIIKDEVKENFIKDIFNNQINLIKENNTIHYLNRLKNI